jgi:hypothetical protein
MFVLFHQPDAARLEVIALTGDRTKPRGSLQFVVEDLNKIKKASMDEKWQGLSTVRTTFPVPEDWPPIGMSHHFVLYVSSNISLLIRFSLLF